MIKKRQITEFIDKVENKAVKFLEEEKQKEINGIKTKEYSKYSNEIAILQSRLAKLISDTNELRNKMIDSGSVRDRGYDYDGRCISSLNTAFSNLKRYESLDYRDPEVMVIKNKWDKKIFETKREYNALRAKMKNKAAKKCKEELAALGFDVSSIRDEDAETSLVQTIDTSKLFVCGERN